MAGLDENLNKLETEYLKNFNQVNRWNLDSNGDLVLTISHNGEPYDVMMFQKN